MRLARLVATAGTSLLALTAAGAAAAPAAPSTVASLGQVVSLRPGALHAAPRATAAPPSTGSCEKRFHIACYTPQQIEAAYHLPALYKAGVRGQGQTIVIVDSFGSPTVRHDLSVFSKAARLPAASLRIIQPAGKVPPYRPTSTRTGWAGETDLDVEYAHAIAPDAKLLLVETPTSENEGTTGFPQIVTAEKFVIDHHLGSVISQSFSATEQTFPSHAALRALRGAYTDAAAKGVTVLAASGDSGAADVKFNGSTLFLRPVTSWPDSDPLVTGVGGTQLHMRGTAIAARPTVWNDTFNVPTNQFITGGKGPSPLAGGGGKSAVFSRPSYQNGVKKVAGGSRGVPDVSMSAACNGGADMFQSFKGQPTGWFPTCGTSEATPEFAGIVALAAQVAGHSLGLINPALYSMSAHHAPGIVDVITGNNTVAFRQDKKLRTVRGFTALRGYDLASGIGTVNAPLFVPELAHAAR